MKQKPTIQLIELSDIKINTKYSLHPFALFFTKETQDSIESIGIIHPPIVQEINNSFHLISGHRRIIHFQKKNQSTIACLVLNETTSNADLLRVILTDQQLHEPLSVVERSYFLKLCRGVLSDEEIISQFASKIPCRKHKSAISEGINILSTFEPSTLLLIHNGIISEQTAITILSMNKEDCQAIVQLIDDLRPGGGKQKRIISLLRDICGREQVSICNYLQTERIREILNHQEMNRPQKTQQITEYLQTAHTPQSTQAQNAFQEFQQQLDLPGGTNLHHSPAFEKDELTLSIQFKNLKEFKVQWATFREFLIKQRSKN